MLTSFRSLLRFGGPGRTQAFRAAAGDALGNRDGISGNEGGPAGDLSALPRGSGDPLVRRFTDAFEGLPNWRSGSKELTALIQELEARDGALVEPTFMAHLPRRARGPFLAERAVELLRLERPAQSIRDSFLPVSGSVRFSDAQGKPRLAKIGDRTLATRLYLPPDGSAPRGILSLALGYQENPDNALLLIQELNRLGWAVSTFDPQWKGNTVGGDAGKIDRGLGVLRDVAAHAVATSELGQREFGLGPDAFRMIGVSMEGGLVGVIGAKLLLERGDVLIKGAAPFPKGVQFWAMNPYCGRTPGVVNNALAAAGHVWPLNQIPFPAMRVPALSDNPAVLAQQALLASTGRVKVRLQALVAADPDMARVQRLIDSGNLPAGRGFFTVASHDPLADPARSQAVGAQLGAEVRVLPDVHSHLQHQDPAFLGLVREFLERGPPA